MIGFFLFFIFKRRKVQMCRKICGLGCVTRALVNAWFTQPSPRIFWHFCTFFNLVTTKYFKSFRLWYPFGTGTRIPSPPFSPALSLHLRPLNSCIIAKLCDPTLPPVPLSFALSPLFQSRNEQMGDFPSHSKMNSKPPGQLGWIYALYLGKVKFCSRSLCFGTQSGLVRD